MSVVLLRHCTAAGTDKRGGEEQWGDSAAPAAGQKGHKMYADNNELCQRPQCAGYGCAMCRTR